MASRKVWKIFLRNKLRELTVEAGSFWFCVLLLICAFMWVSMVYAFCLRHPIFKEIVRYSMYTFAAAFVLLMVWGMALAFKDWIRDDWKEAKIEAHRNERE